jgi:hypothetical protein
MVGGLKASADGKSPRFPVVISRPKADIPITAGSSMPRLIAPPLTLLILTSPVGVKNFYETS